MHEHSLMRRLVRQCLQLAAEERAHRVTRVTIRLGALSHSDPDTLRAYFAREAQGTIADGAELNVVVTDELLELTLATIEVEREEEDGIAG